MKLLNFAVAFFAASSAIAAPLAKRAEDKNKTILLTNDDGWASTNIRATYSALKDAGYDVLLVSPVRQRSGYGGTFHIPQSTTLEEDGEFSYPPAGSPSWGHEDNDKNIWYFNGTPASCVAFAMSHVLPKEFDNKSIDLVVAGPNEGVNLAPGLFTLSGTMGATYHAVLRGLPAISFSGSNETNAFFKDDGEKLSDEKFPPVIYAKKVVELVDRLFDESSDRPRILPKTTGLNVNFPFVGNDDEDCLDPDWMFARLTGEDSVTPNLKVLSNGTIIRDEGVYKAPTECIFGDCDLPSESWVNKNLKCKTPISVFSIDYDASFRQARSVQSLLSPLF